MFRKSILSILSLLLVLTVFAGCGAAGTAMDSEFNKGESIAPESSAGADLEAAADSTRKLIRTVSISAQTKQYETFLETVKARTVEAGGYVESSNENLSPNHTYRSATLLLRIPVAETDGLLTLIGELGTVTRKEENVSDVTLQYVDTQAHLNALRAEEESLLRLLEDARSVEEIIFIRERLSKLNYEIEAYESTLRTFDNQVDYATVTLFLSEVERVVEVDPSMWGEIGVNLADAMNNIGTFFRNAFVFFVSSLPYLIVFVLLPGAIVFFSVYGAIRRKRRKDPK